MSSLQSGFISTRAENLFGLHVMWEVLTGLVGLMTTTSDKAEEQPQCDYGC